MSDALMLYNSGGHRVVGLCVMSAERVAGFPCLPESPGFFVKFPGPGKSWKFKLKVLEFAGMQMRKYFRPYTSSFRDLF